MVTKRLLLSRAWLPSTIPALFRLRRKGCPEFKPARMQRDTLYLKTQKKEKVKVEGFAGQWGVAHAFNHSAQAAEADGCL